MREESVAEREAAVTAQEAALAEDKAALAAVKAAPAEEEAAFAKKLAEEKAALAKVKATLAKDKADLKVRVKAMERAEARHAAERAAAKAAQEKADRRRPNQDFDEAQAAQAREDLKPRPGALLDESQSRMILMLYFHLVLEGDSPNAAVNKTACTVRVGVEKVLKVISFRYTGPDCTAEQKPKLSFIACRSSPQSTFDSDVEGSRIGRYSESTAHSRTRIMSAPKIECLGCFYIFSLPAQ